MYVFLFVLKANIFLSRSDDDGKGEELMPKIGDFGISLAESLAGSGCVHLDGFELVCCGLSFVFFKFFFQRPSLGTPGYISPEIQRHGSAGISPKSDVYALGVVLAELFTPTRAHDCAHQPSKSSHFDLAHLEPRGSPPGLDRPNHRTHARHRPRRSPHRL